MSVRPILLVEDNRDDEELMRLALRRNGIDYPIVVAHDGVEAVEYLLGSDRRGPAELPRLVLLDLNLPRLDGLEVLRRIRANERTSLIPVVILTSSQELHERLSSYRLRCNSYIRKPVDFSEFIKTANHLIHYWMHVNEAAPD